ncbi:hypothetical protein N5W20_03625 [Candidatus Kirkpatrickella diaphorinae]|uniref:Pertussis toxin subunit 1 n=1 Tax=Candidatus Kirkpatrickella diaphorinae TaxID=2984322 RepID=A0ABY6GKA0_9PROT|nr:hypothetical protein [Candidatus Kirkpatrickella diaphorinae]UYH51956.1 hypothetical protein N5W20_03625 [Candidatus Kirkpatrickella diaphorinae]
MKRLTAALLIASAAFASAGYAIDPPDMVYKVSYRPPETTFLNGFVAVGRDRDVVRFASGASTRDSSTAYVSTLDSWHHVSYVVESTARRNPELPIYIYYARPTENFFNVEESLLFARDVLPSGAARRQVNDLWLATRGWTQGSWVATAAIAGDQISGARRYYWNNGDPYYGAYIVNWNYYYLPPEVSRGPMPVHNATVDAAEVAEEAHGVGFMPAAVANMACDAQPRRLGNAQTQRCPTVESLSFDTLRTKAIAKLIASGILVSALPAQLVSEAGHDEL